MRPAEFSATRATLLFRLRQDGLAREIAWREFHDYYAPIIAGFAPRMGARASETDDIVQDVILGFFAAAPEFAYDPAMGRFRGYLKTCTWRKLEKHLGKRLRLAGDAGAVFDAAEPRVETIWHDIWENEMLQRALRMVRGQHMQRADKRKTFQAFEMSAMLERPVPEIAAELDMSAESIHQAKSRVTKALREVMDAMDAFND